LSAAKHCEAATAFTGGPFHAMISQKSDKKNTLKPKPTKNQLFTK